MNNVEVGYKGVFPSGYVPKATLNINYYLMQYKDQLVLTGKLNDVGAPLKENVPVSYRTGVEVTGSVNFYRLGNSYLDDLYKVASGTRRTRKVFSINYSFTYSLNKIKSFDEYVYTYDDNYSPIDSLSQIIKHKNSDISFSPSIIAALELVAYPVKGLEISLMNKAVSKQYLDNTSNEERKLKPFFYSNLKA